MDYYLVAKTLFPFKASSISFDFVHPVKEQSKLSLLYALSLIEMQIRILSSFFLFIMVFFCVCFVCCFGLMLYLCAVMIAKSCGLERVLIPILLHVWFLCWEHFAPSFFVCMVFCFGLILLLVSEKTVFSNFVLSCVVIVYIFGGLQSYKRDTIRNVFYYYYRIWASDVFLDILIVG